MDLLTALSEQPQSIFTAIERRVSVLASFTRTDVNLDRIDAFETLGLAEALVAQRRDTWLTTGHLFAALAEQALATGGEKAKVDELRNALGMLMTPAGLKLDGVEYQDEDEGPIRPPTQTIRPPSIPSEERVSEIPGSTFQVAIASLADIHADLMGLEDGPEDVRIAKDFIAPVLAVAIGALEGNPGSQEAIREAVGAIKACHGILVEMKTNLDSHAEEPWTPIIRGFIEKAIFELIKIAVTGPGS